MIVLAVLRRYYTISPRGCKAKRRFGRGDLAKTEKKIGDKYNRFALVAALKICYYNRNGGNARYEQFFWRER